MPEHKIHSHRDNQYWCPTTREWKKSPARMAVIEANRGRPPEHQEMTRKGAITRENAVRATEIRSKMLQALENRIATIEETAETPEEAAAMISGLAKADTLRLLTDSEDRGYGKPTQKQELAHSLSKRIEEEMTPEEAADIYAREISRA